MHYRIGTRCSKLALVQSEYVKRRMEEAYPEDTFELVIIKTTGDKVTDLSLIHIYMCIRDRVHPGILPV